MILRESFESALNSIKANALRELKDVSGLVDFSSNDYLGLSQHPQLLATQELSISGATSSRLVCGNLSLNTKLEKKISEWKGSEETLILNSGYQANMALISAVPQKGDTIIYDQLSHICLKEGAWLSKAESVMAINQKKTVFYQIIGAP